MVQNSVKQEQIDVSVLIPVLNESQSIELLSNQIVSVVEEQKLNYEIIFIDDGSTDETSGILEKLNLVNPRVKYIKLRRNQGKAIVYTVGFTYAEGDTIITMDGDLQDDPKDIPKLLNKLKEGNDLVNGWKHTGKGDPVRSFYSKVFNFGIRKLTGLQIHDINCPLKAYKKDVAKTLNLYGELHRFIPLILYSKGYRILETPVENHARRFGTSRYGCKRYVKALLDLITVTYLLGYMRRPVHFYGTVGLTSAFAGVLVCMAVVIADVLCPIHMVLAIPLLLLGILLLLLGIQLLSVGLLGEMIISLTPLPVEHDIEYRIGF